MEPAPQPVRKTRRYLNPVQINEIIHLYLNTKEKVSSIAEKYHVAQSTVSKIIAARWLPLRRRRRSPKVSLHIHRGDHRS
jgi:transposase-like protein